MVSVYGTVHFDKGMTEIMMGIWAAPLWATPSHSSALHVRKWALLIWASYPSALLSVFLIYYVKARKGSSLQAAEEPGETATSNTQQHLGLCKHWKTILVGPPGLHSNSLNRLWPASLYVAPQLSIVVKTQNFGWPSYFKKKKKKVLLFCYLQWEKATAFSFTLCSFKCFLILPWRGWEMQVEKSFSFNRKEMSWKILFTVFCPVHAMLGKVRFSLYHSG